VMMMRRTEEEDPFTMINPEQIRSSGSAFG
jgi:hypothetical protein